MSYCVKCRKQTPDINGKQEKSKNGKIMFKSKCGVCGSRKSRFMKSKHGRNIDAHKLIGKSPRPKTGFTPGEYKYLGPYNPLENQLKYDKNGKITKWHVKPYNKVDELAAHHDVCYSLGKNKGDCDRQMVKSLDQIPYGEMRKWGQTARFLINAKQKLGMGIKSENQKKPSSNWQEKLADELHTPIKCNFTRRLIIVNHIDEIWAADLVDM